MIEITHNVFDETRPAMLDLARQIASPTEAFRDAGEVDQFMQKLGVVLEEAASLESKGLRHQISDPDISRDYEVLEVSLMNIWMDMVTEKEAAQSHGVVTAYPFVLADEHKLSDTVKSLTFENF
ncbi:MAG: hypothetical protein CMH28_03230 [Micavibrio sp.]|nr:hypothetical protein [Micavibrio sp.]|tara:strand:+ start:744 stop:1115 length:372 start_codon:yes stop_codon:yes gene_type:complete